MKINKSIVALLLAATIGFTVVGCSSEPSTDNSTETSTQETTYTMKHGELLEKTINDDILVIKAKIEPSYKNSATLTNLPASIVEV